MPLLAWIILGALVAVYISYYYRSPRDIAVLQTTLAEFDFSVLLKKQPVVVADAVTDIKDLKKLWFPYNFVTHQSNNVQHATWHRNGHKFYLIQPVHDCEVLMCPANTKITKEGVPDPETTSLLAIKCKADHLLVIPYRWMYFVEHNVGCHTMGVHDWMTKWLPL